MKEALQSTRHELGLDRPMIVQYGDWLMDLCKGDMGTSYKSNRPVLSEMTAKNSGNTYSDSDSTWGYNSAFYSFRYLVCVACRRQK